MKRQITFKHKSGKIIKGEYISSFIYKPNLQEYYIILGDDNKKYSVNPKNIIKDETN